jgi:hypothetical protein
LLHVGFLVLCCVVTVHIYNDYCFVLCKMQRLVFKDWNLFKFDSPIYMYKIKVLNPQ